MESLPPGGAGGFRTIPSPLPLSLDILPHPALLHPGECKVPPLGPCFKQFGVEKFSDETLKKTRVCVLLLLQTECMTTRIAHVSNRAFSPRGR